MESTQTPTRVAYGHQQRELIAGRYRLASFHRGDESTEVWRALDESTKRVVSLEFLRDPDPASRERFLAGARRLASLEQPSVMRVVAIQDDPGGAFIVFEHLVDIPVPDEWLQPGTVETMTVEPAATQPTMDLTAVTPEAPTSDLANERPTDRGLSLLIFALRTRELSLIDMPLLQESATEFAAIARSELGAVRLDPSVIDDFRAFVTNVDLSALMSAPARAAGAARRLTTLRPRVRVPRPDAPYPTQVRKIRIKPVVPAQSAVPRAPRVRSGPRLRVRWGRVLTRGLSLGILAAILIAMPSEMIGNVGNMANELSVAIREKLAAMVPSTPTLQRASFELPPLSAYSAAFESQAPYPHASPNGTVEWVVALRNTGSVGWYRGIDGAQASLALADGTAAGVQTTDFVGPGQVGWFVVHFPAPSQVGTSKVPLLPRIDGRGSLPDLGIYATVTVSPNP